MRATMPETADWIARKRLEWGKAHVDACLRCAVVDKTPGYFYAIEAGNFSGTPFPASHPADEWQQFAVLTGCTFAIFMLQPGSPEPAIQTAAQGATS